MNKDYQLNHQDHLHLKSNQEEKNNFKFIFLLNGNTYLQKN